MFKKIVNNLLLAPQMSDKWSLNRNDIILIFCNEHLTLKFQNEKIDLNNKAFSIYGYSGQLILKNKKNSNIKIFAVHFEYSADTITDLLLMLKETFTSHIANAFIEEIESLFIEKPDFYVSKNENNIDTRLIKVHRYIRNNYCYQINLNTLSALINVHPTYLSNSYNKVFDISPILHLNTLKIEKAKDLLENTSLQIKEIAQLVGASSLPQFSSLFKRFTNMTPCSYRLSKKRD